VCTPCAGLGSLAQQPLPCSALRAHTSQQPQHTCLQVVQVQLGTQLKECMHLHCAAKGVHVKGQHGNQGNTATTALQLLGVVLTLQLHMLRLMWQGEHMVSCSTGLASDMHTACICCYCSSCAAAAMLCRWLPCLCTQTAHAPAACSLLPSAFNWLLPCRMAAKQQRHHTNTCWAHA
jgi:hypothetical protein